MPQEGWLPVQGFSGEASEMRYMWKVLQMAVQVPSCQNYSKSLLNTHFQSSLEWPSLEGRSVVRVWASKGPRLPQDPPLSCCQPPFHQSLQCSRSGVAAENLHLNQVPWSCWCCSSREHTLRTKVLWDEQDVVKQWQEQKTFKGKELHTWKGLEVERAQCIEEQQNFRWCQERSRGRKNPEK